MPAWVTISFQSLTKCRRKQRTIGTFVLYGAFGIMKVTVHMCSFGLPRKAYCHGLFRKKHVYDWHRLEDVFQCHTLKSSCTHIIVMILLSCAVQKNLHNAVYFKNVLFSIDAEFSLGTLDKVTSCDHKYPFGQNTSCRWFMTNLIMKLCLINGYACDNSSSSWPISKFSFDQICIQHSTYNIHTLDLYLKKTILHVLNTQLLQRYNVYMRIIWMLSCSGR